MNSYKRIGNKWSVNEILSLQREYELLEWSIDQIAEKHKRSVNSILFRLESEGFIDSWNSARGFNEKYNKKNQECYNSSDEDNDSEYFDEELEYYDEGFKEIEKKDDNIFINYNTNNEEKLSERICDLETNVTEIAIIINKILKKINKINKKNK